MRFQELKGSASARARSERSHPSAQGRGFHGTSPSGTNPAAISGI